MLRIVCVLAVVCSLSAMAADPNPVVVIETSQGNVEVELYADKAPETVKNFLGYVSDKFYDGTIFHRVIKSFMIQGGGFTADMQQKPTKAPIKNEAGNGLKNDEGTIAMARTGIVDSATSQFFINAKNNDFLNHSDETARGFGYCVFGKVTTGLDVVKKIENTATGMKNGMGDVPTDTVTIKSITLKK